MPPKVQRQRQRRTARQRPAAAERENDAIDPDLPDLLGVARHRLRSQLLTGPRLDRPEAVVARMGAVQAQDYHGAKWAVGQRAKGCADADVEAAFTRGEILRTHVMRPTWHFVVPADIRWLLQLTAPRVQAFSAGYYRQVGLDGAALARGDDALAKALQGGRHWTRDELDDPLRAAGLPTDGLRLTFLVMHAELEAVICSGPRRGKQFTYAALDERAPGARVLPRDQALAELARRYFAGHGPALPRDFAWWSGLKVADAVTAIRSLDGELEQVRAGGHTYWAAAPAAPASRATRPSRAPAVRLLPNFDEYLVAFRDHAAVFDARFARDLGAREGVLANHVVVANGRVVGGWRRTLTKDEVLVETTLVVALDDGERAALATEVARYGRFLGLRARLETSAPRRVRSAR